MSRIVVLGASGAMGCRVTERLETRGHDVVRASRATGVDAAGGAGLAAAFEGADIVVDCLNITTASRRKAVAFFTGTATRVAAAARTAGIGHIVALSIVNTMHDGVRAALGYYAAKAAQEQTYAGSGLPVTVVATTQWFTLAEQFLDQVPVGPMALVPSMMLQPVHPDAAADLLASRAVAGPGAARVELAGPERIRADVMAGRLAQAQGRSVRVIGIPFPGRAFRRSGLLPHDGDVQIDPRTYAAWLAQVRSARR